MAHERRHKRGVISKLFGEDAGKIENLEISLRRGIKQENENFKKIQDFSTNVVRQVSDISDWSKASSASMRKNSNIQMVLARKIHQMSNRATFLNLR